MGARALKPGAARRCVEALALLHKPQPLSAEERARIEAELARPRQEKQPELTLPETHP